MTAILDAAKQAKIIYLAADDDREGEAIAYSVACLLKKDPLSFPRAVFHEITSTAIRAAVENPRKIDMNKVYAQQARSVLDMLVGFTISPVLWKHVARGLSAGRCQTPALRLVYDREKESKSHSTKTSWIASGSFQNTSSQNKSKSFDAKLEDELEDQESALNYLENIHKELSPIVHSASVSKWTANPPKPLITSSLQQEASALHKINPKATMKIAQSLYEAGHITYMRTDFAVLSKEAIAESQAWVKKNFGEQYVGPETKAAASASSASSASGTQAQEAHEAIRPTHVEVSDPPGDWTPQEKHIYTLIWKRAVQSTMSAAYGKTRSIKLIFGGDTDFQWSAQAKKTEFQGWQRLGKPADLDADSDEDDANAPPSEEESRWKDFIALTPGTVCSWSKIQASPKRTKASPRFTEATLIRELEKKGIGRPSTFASLVEVLFDKSYVEKKDIVGEKAAHTVLSIQPNTWPPLTQLTQINLGAEKQKLVPTSLVESVVAFCVREFPQLFA
jgi:DNA topoisomerase-1